MTAATTTPSKGIRMITTMINTTTKACLLRASMVTAKVGGLVGEAMTLKKTRRHSATSQ